MEFQQQCHGLLCQFGQPFLEMVEPAVLLECGQEKFLSLWYHQLDGLIQFLEEVGRALSFWNCIGGNHLSNYVVSCCRRCEPLPGSLTMVKSSFSFNKRNHHRYQIQFRYVGESGGDTGGVMIEASVRGVHAEESLTPALPVLLPHTEPGRRVANVYV